jgi:hypothetical protein
MSQAELNECRSGQKSSGGIVSKKTEQTASSPSAFAPASAKAPAYAEAAAGKSAGKMASADKRPSPPMGKAREKSKLRCV